MSAPAVLVRDATAADVPALLRLIKALADYEKLAHAVTATEAQLRESLFGAKPHAEAVIALVGDEPVGLALYFHNYSTFLAKPGIYLEDLFVLPEWRSKGVGKQLFARIAQIGVARGCGRMEWSVLDWNEPAIGFYKKMGARAMEEWTVYRLTGAELDAAARTSS